MNRHLLAFALGVASLSPLPAGAELTVEPPTGPAEIGIDTPVSMTVTVSNDADAISDYTVELYRTFLTPQGDVFSRELLVSYWPEITLETGVTVIEVPVTFELGGSYNIEACVIGAEGEEVVSQSAVFEVKFDRPENFYTKTMPGSDIPTRLDQYFTYTDGRINAGSQTIYPATMTGLPRSASIYSLTWYYRNFEYNLDSDFRYRVYLGQCDPEKVSFVRNEPLLTGFEKVYDGIAPRFHAVGEEAEAWTLPLGRAYSYDSSRNLVVVIVITSPKDDADMVRPYFITSVVDDYATTYCRWSKAGSFFDSTVNGATYFTNNSMPLLTFDYVLDEEKALSDMAAVELRLPSAGVTAGEQATFRVQVKNEGTVTVNEFAIELLDVTAGMDNATVLTSVDVTEPYGPGSEGTERVRFTFDNEGEYTLAARIVYPDDSDEANNTTEPVALHVGKGVGVEAVAAGCESLAYAGETLRIAIETATSLQIFSADGRMVAAESLDGATVLPLSLEKGLYIASVTDASGKAYILKFFK